VQLNQTQKTGKTSTTIVRGNAAVNVVYDVRSVVGMTVAPWSGSFQNRACGHAFTNDAPIWVQHAAVDKSVKLVRRR
jgi:hypothetical protein